MRKILIGFVVVAVIALAVHFRFHRAKAPREMAYAANREVTIWNTTAQVRSAVATASFGDPLAVIDRFGDQVQVRTSSGIVGWASDHDLLSAEFWQKAKELDAAAANLPVEARGHTRVLSNLHLDPGRDSPRVRQLAKDVPLELFQRRAEAAAPPAGKPAAPDVRAGDATATAAKKEDWWLVRAHFSDQTSMAGWLLGRFIDLDVPAPLPDYASSAGMRIVAWFELNRVSDEPPRGLDAGARKTGKAAAAAKQLAVTQAAAATAIEKPQYLVVGDRGSEGQSCDFTLMRVFTWGNQRQRYETAYVESDVCGKLPVKVTPAATPGGDASFTFVDLSAGAPENRLYKMHQTIVRRVREPGAPPAKKHQKTNPALTLPPHHPRTSVGASSRN